MFYFCTLCKKLLKRLTLCISTVKGIIRGLLVLAAGGRECAVCGARCGALFLCKKCQERVMRNMSISADDKRCCVCGRTLISERGICMRCRDSNKRVLHSTKRVLPLSSYRLWMRNLILSWKENGEKALSPFFARRAADALMFLDCKAVVPVPPRQGKLRTAGWDQIDDLCTNLMPQFKVLKLLYRTNNVQQKSLEADDRLKMIHSGTYRMKENNALKKALRSAGGVMPERVCLIDDVMTTGATIECCAKALHDGGIKEVDVVTLSAVD